MALLTLLFFFCSSVFLFLLVDVDNTNEGLKMGFLISVVIFVIIFIFILVL